jgi:CheY-like chemotaxis protein
MPNYRILIVEDQSDVRNMLRSGLETLGPEFEVVDTPSGEEAFLELTRHKYNLLIADVRLAGMSGIELKTKALTINADIKVILITGVSDPIFRRQVAEAGADAYFFKPIVMKNLFNAVEELLKVDIPSLQLEEAAPTQVSESTKTAINKRLTTLQLELNAISIVLLATNGNVISIIGNLPDNALKSDQVVGIVNLLNTGNELSELMSKTTAQDLYYFEEKDYNFSMTHVDKDYSILAFTPKERGVVYLDSIGLSLHKAAQDLSILLTQAATKSGSVKKIDETDRAETIKHEEKQDALPDSDIEDSTVDVDTSETLPDVEEIFQSKGDEESFSKDEIDAFWDSALEEIEPDSYPPRTNSISYDEAHDLGITPDGEED